MSDSTSLTQDEIWHMYVVRCHDDSLYCGISKDIERRFSEHQKMGKKTAKYLRGRGPLKLVFAMTIGDYAEALRAEREFKALKKIEKEMLIKKQNFILGETA